jgi:hypothetical protein
MSDSDSVSVDEDESSEPDNSDYSDEGKIELRCKKDKKSGDFLRFTGLNIIVDNSEAVVEVVSVFIGANLIQLFTDQSSLYHTQNALQWKVLSESLKWSGITPSEKVFRTNNSDDRGRQ